MICKQLRAEGQRLLPVRIFDDGQQLGRVIQERQHHWRRGRVLR
jgi:hypothetical protein